MSLVEAPLCSLLGHLRRHIDRLQGLEHGHLWGSVIVMITLSKRTQLVGWFLFRPLPGMWNLPESDLSFAKCERSHGVQERKPGELCAWPSTFLVTSGG